MFEKAIKIILSEPPEAHYPSYYANLLREADVPDKDVGKCSEFPNSSETIYRQDAIDALKRLQKNVSGDYTELDPLVMAGCGYIGDCIGELECLPPAQPDIAEKLYQHKCYITDQEGLQHEIIHVGDIRRVTGWEI